MSTYVFIHGSWHGAWCWYKLIPLLRRAGHRAIAIDLAGHGKDWTPARKVSMQSYVDDVVDVLDEQIDPVILVGHSRGGIVISQVAECRPEKIKTLVYLAAYLIPDGEAMSNIADGDTESLIMSNLKYDQEEGSYMLDSGVFRSALYADCESEDVALASLLLTPEPSAPIATPLRLSDERFGKVPRVYIECTNDRGVSPALQRKMYTALPCRKVVSMATSHSPFFSAPEELVRELLGI